MLGGLRFFAFFGALLLLMAGSARAQELEDQPAKARLILDSEMRDGLIYAALKLEIREGWHVYWRNPGASGLPTELSWDLPEGFRAGPLLWPAPHRFGREPEQTYGYSGSLVLVSKIEVPKGWKPGPVTLAAAASWMVCKDACVLGEQRIEASWPREGSKASAAAIQAVLNQQPRPLSELGLSLESKRPAPASWEMSLSFVEKPAAGLRVEIFPEPATDVGGEVEFAEPELRWSAQRPHWTLALKTASGTPPGKLSVLVVLREESRIRVFVASSEP